MRKALPVSLIVAGLLACNVSFAQDANSSKTFLTEPFLQRLGTDRITISWELSKPTECAVAFGADTSYGHTQKPTMTVSKKDRTGAGATCVYLCTLTGLKPGQGYHYRVTVGDHKTEDRKFRTAPTVNEDFTFAVWGDSQAVAMIKGENQPITAILRHIRQSKASFAIAVGDMSPNGRFYNDVRQCVLDTVCKELGRTIPFMITWGNHDGKRTELIRTCLPANNGTYSFNYAGCHFLCIDMYDRNFTFIEKDLKQAREANARYIFVFMHHPPSESKDFVMCKEYLTKLIPMMKKYGAEACFCGHWHRYQHFTVGGVQCYVTGGGNMGSLPSPHYLQVHVNDKGWTVTKHSFFEKRKKR